MPDRRLSSVPIDVSTRTRRRAAAADFLKPLSTFFAERRLVLCRRRLIATLTFLLFIAFFSTTINAAVATSASDQLERAQMDGFNAPLSDDERRQLREFFGRRLGFDASPTPHATPSGRRDEVRSNGESAQTNVAFARACRCQNLYGSFILPLTKLPSITPRATMRRRSSTARASSSICTRQIGGHTPSASRLRSFDFASRQAARRRGALVCSSAIVDANCYLPSDKCRCSSTTTATAAAG